MIEDYYISDGFVTKRPSTINSGGIATVTLTDVSEISGRMRDLSGYEVVTNEKKGYTTTHRFYCAASVDINEKDILYDSNNDKYYEVSVVRNPMQMDKHLEVDCEFKKDLQNSYE